MISIAIAEDEYIERLSLSRFIEERFPDASVIWTAENGQIALESINQMPPDIVIIDINMPVMNGLDLCRQLQEQKFLGVRVINTAFSVFEYAQRAVEYGVSDYLLKPSPMEEMARVLGRCVEKARKAATERAAARVQNERIARAKRQAEVFAIQSLRGACVDVISTLGWPEDHLMARVTRINGERILDVETRLKCLRAEFESVAQFVSATEAEEMVLLTQPILPCEERFWHTLSLGFALDLAQLLTKDDRMAVSPLCRTEGVIREACRANDRWVDGESAAPKVARQCKKLHGLRRSEYDWMISRIQYFLRDAQIEHAIAMLSLSEDKSCWDRVQLALETIVSVQPGADLRPFLHAIVALTQGKTAPWTDAIETFCRAASQASNETTMERALRRMQEQFAGDITLTSMAEELGLAPTTFSRMFKQHTGQTFIDRLTDIRIRHALDILDEHPQCSLDALATACGIASRSYFCTVFKRTMGMTVTQYVQERQPS